MLEFRSANVRSVNLQRAVLEALELAFGTTTPACDLVLLNAGVGHDLDRLSQAVRAQCPKARVLAASCAGVVGREGPGESIHDIALMGISGEGFTISYVDGLVRRHVLRQGRGTRARPAGLSEAGAHDLPPRLGHRHRQRPRDRRHRVRARAGRHDLRRHQLRPDAGRRDLPGGRRRHLPARRVRRGDLGPDARGRHARDARVRGIRRPAHGHARRGQPDRRARRAQRMAHLAARPGRPGR